MPTKKKDPVRRTMLARNTALLLESRDQSHRFIDGDDSPSSLIEISLSASSQDDTASIKETAFDDESSREQTHEETTRVQAEETEQEEHLEATASIQLPTKEICFINDSEQPEEVRMLLEIKHKYEAEMVKYAEQITTLKETIVEMRGENNHLRNDLRDFKSNNPERVIADLEEEVKKWETLYFETAEMGSARMCRLEEELEQLRASSKTERESSERAQKHTKNLCKALKATHKSAKSKHEELEQYKQRATERESFLNEMLKKAHADKEQGLKLLKSKHETEREDLLEKIEDLEADLKAKSAIIDRERNQASKREARLKEQIRKLQKTNEAESATTSKPSSEGVFDSALKTFGIVLDGSLCMCSAQG